MSSRKIKDSLIDAVWGRICQADRILIAAGSGMSVDAGIDYSDTEYFAHRFPAMAKRGFRMQYEAIGYQEWTEALKWGFLADHVNAVRFETPPHPVYTNLLQLVLDKDYFVVTTNVDGLFVKSGFAKERIFTPQGDYARYQCLQPCSHDTWPIKQIIKQILPTIDPATQEITDPRMIPYCPNCGGPVFMNVRGGEWFIEEPYLGQWERYTEWLNSAWSNRLLIIEIGSGFNTPSVIRWPMEYIIWKHPSAHLVRVNPLQAFVPEDLTDRATSIYARGIDLILPLAARARYS